MNPPASSSLLVIDDHPVFRQGLVAVLSALPEVREVRQIGDLAEAWALLATCPPACATLDLHFANGNGFSLLERARAARLSTRFVVVSLFADESLLARARALGASAFVPKEKDVRAVVEAVRAALAEPGPHPSGSRGEDAPPDLEVHLPLLAALPRLTPAERLVLQHLALNRTSAEIGARLTLSPRTVQNHRAHMCEKLGLQGNNKLLEVAIALREVLGPPPQG